MSAKHTEFVDLLKTIAWGRTYHTRERAKSTRAYAGTTVQDMVRKALIAHGIVEWTPKERKQ